MSAVLDPTESVTQTQSGRRERGLTIDQHAYLWTVAQYQEIVRQGILTTDDRVELLKGVVVCKMTNNPRHAEVIEQLTSILPPHVPAGWRLRIQLPVQSGDSQPEPDFAIVRTDRRRGNHPFGEDVLLVIEVADSSLSLDREKSEIYAQAAIPNYWIINLPEQQVETYGRFNPVSGEYDLTQIYHLGERVRLPLQSEFDFSVDELLSS